MAVIAVAFVTHAKIAAVRAFVGQVHIQIAVKHVQIRILAVLVLIFILTALIALVIVTALFLLALAMIVTQSYNPFLYFRF